MIYRIDFVKLLASLKLATSYLKKQKIRRDFPSKLKVTPSSLESEFVLRRNRLAKKWFSLKSDQKPEETAQGGSSSRRSYVSPSQKPASQDLIYSLLLISAPLVYFLVHPSFPTLPNPDGVQVISAPQVSILTESSVTEDLADLAQKPLIGSSTTSYLNLDRLLSVLEKPRFSQGIALPISFDLPENSPGRFTAGPYQGQTMPWVSSNEEEMYDFDSFLEPLEKIWRTAEEAQIISSVGDFDFKEKPAEGVSLRPIFIWLNDNSKESGQRSTSVQVPTPALLPGIVAFGLRFERKQKQKSVG